MKIIYIMYDYNEYPPRHRYVWADFSNTKEMDIYNEFPETDRFAFSLGKGKYNLKWDENSAVSLDDAIRYVGGDKK